MDISGDEDDSAHYEEEEDDDVEEENHEQNLEEDEDEYSDEEDEYSGDEDDEYYSEEEDEEEVDRWRNRRRPRVMVLDGDTVIGVQASESQAEMAAAADGGAQAEKSAAEMNRSEIDGLFCPICMEAWSSGGNHQICCLPCGHIYGMSCIKKWLESRRTTGKCPLCNKKCEMKDVRLLYASQLHAVDEKLQKKVQSLEEKCDYLEKKKVKSLEAKCDYLEKKVADANRPDWRQYMDQRFDAMEARFSQQLDTMKADFDAMKADFDQRFQQLNRVIATMQQRIGGPLPPPPPPPPPP